MPETWCDLVRVPRGITVIHSECTTAILVVLLSIREGLDHLCCVHIERAYRDDSVVAEGRSLAALLRGSLTDLIVEGA